MRRREFIAAFAGAAAAWPLAARAQQATLPVVGFLAGGSVGDLGYLASAFRQGLAEAGFVEGRNISIEYRWTEGKFDRAPELIADLVRRRTALIATGGTTLTLAAKAATSTIPILFISGVDAIDAGLVNSLNRPEGNLTGVNLFSNVVTAKRLQLLHQLVPTTRPLAMLVNPGTATEREIRDVRAAADGIGRQIKILPVGNDHQLDAAFTAVAEQRIGGLLLQTEPFLTSRRDQLVLLTTRHSVPTISGFREFPQAGGLMSYGTDLTEAWRQLGVYAARLLKGEKPVDLPVLQPTKFELIINLKSARALDLRIPTTILALADAVIE